MDVCDKDMQAVRATRDCNYINEMASRAADHKERADSYLAEYRSLAEIEKLRLTARAWDLVWAYVVMWLVLGVLLIDALLFAPSAEIFIRSSFPGIPDWLLGALRFVVPCMFVGLETAFAIRLSIEIENARRQGEGRLNTPAVIGWFTAAVALALIMPALAAALHLAGFLMDFSIPVVIQGAALTLLVLLGHLGIVASGRAIRDAKATLSARRAARRCRRNERRERQHERRATRKALEAFRSLEDNAAQFGHPNSIAFVAPARGVLVEHLGAERVRRLEEGVRTAPAPVSAAQAPAAHGPVLAAVRPTRSVRVQRFRRGRR